MLIVTYFAATCHLCSQLASVIAAREDCPVTRSSSSHMSPKKPTKKLASKIPAKKLTPKKSVNK